MAKIKLDSKNYRVHTEKNKMIIDKSLKELGAGRSILIDSENEIIAGNGVFEQAEKQNIKIKIVETDGTELIAVKRTDLKTNDKKRKKLALIDNHATDTSNFDFDAINVDFEEVELEEWGVDLEKIHEQKDLSEKIDVSYRIEITLESEKEQKQLFEKLKKENYECRLLTL